MYNIVFLYSRYKNEQENIWKNVDFQDCKKNLEIYKMFES